MIYNDKITLIPRLFAFGGFLIGKAVYSIEEFKH